MNLKLRQRKVKANAEGGEFRQSVWEVVNSAGTIIASADTKAGAIGIFKQLNY